jgi:deoxyribodipyrimidine photo-lyase
VIQQQRIKPLNARARARGAYVLYWMQSSVRAEYNHALEYAIREANGLGQPVVVYFGLTAEFPEANARHYHFLLEGLREVEAALRERGVKLVIRKESPEAGVLTLARDASLVVMDRGYLPIQREWRRRVADGLDCPLVRVESDVVVPVEEASPKEEYSAATIRPKIQRRLDDYLQPLEETAVRVDSLGLPFETLDVADVPKLVSTLPVDQIVSKVAGLAGGTEEAKRLLQEFIEHKLDDYDELRNDPTQDCLSQMSPYLHFGQISPLYVALQVAGTDSPGRDAYLEELIVRRELSMNFVHYNAHHQGIEGLPDWCRRTLAEHERDPREYLYTVEEFEAAATHDPYWNAAQREMVVTGKMHGYMRMYWGKKMLEWTESPEKALRVALYLNNKYELDGRDPNGFAGVAWCLGKHDRPWGERPVFGKVRYMNANGLRRKFDADGYVRKVEDQAARAAGRDPCGDGDGGSPGTSGQR